MATNSRQMILLLRSLYLEARAHVCAWIQMGPTGRFDQATSEDLCCALVNPVFNSAQLLSAIERVEQIALAPTAAPVRVLFVAPSCMYANGKARATSPSSQRSLTRLK